MAPADLDRRAPIVEGETFMLAAELEVRQAIRLQYYVSMLALQAETEELQPHMDRTVLHRLIAEVIRDHIRNTDVVTILPTPPHVRVLLVGPYLENLPAIMGRIAAAVNGPAFDTAGGAVRVMLSMGGACFPTTARSRAELLHQAESLGVEARGEPDKSGHRYLLAPPAS